MDALTALGLAYNSDDDEDESENEDVEEPQKKVQRVEPPAIAAAAASSAPALPDAGGLLSGLPDEVDWTARADDSDDELQYDAKGTKYNAVALPASMQKESEAFNNQGRRGGGEWKQAGDNARAAVSTALASTDLLPVGASSAAAAAPPKKPKASSSGGVLLPPQLRGRANVTTEDSKAWSSERKPKPK